MKFTVAAVAVMASVASAQVSFSDIPSSILTCLTPVAASDGCSSPLDFKCQCGKPELITQTADCVSKTPCADQQKGQSVLMQLCQQNGVPINIPTPTCGGSASSAAPSSAAASSAAASSAASAASSAASVASSAASAASSLASKASSMAASATGAASSAAASKTGTPASYSAGAVPMATQAAGLIGAAALAMLAL